MKTERVARTGLSIADTLHPIQTFAQLGGPGQVDNKALIIPCHVGMPWMSVEYVTIPPGHNGVGEHTQRTDEIYLIVAGYGLLTTNGREEQVLPGTLVIAPRGTRHALLNISARNHLSFLVVEIDAVEEGRAASTMNIFSQLHASMDQTAPTRFAIHPTRQGMRPVSFPLAEIDLHAFFGGAWQSLTLLELPPGCFVESYCDEYHDQLLFVMSGYASIRVVANKDEEIRVETGDATVHHSVLVPQGTRASFGNKASAIAYPLLLACLTIQANASGSTTEDAYGA